MQLADIKLGDRLVFIHDDGRYGEAVVCTVIKIGKKKVKVRATFGSRVSEGWKYLNFFDRKIP